MSASVLKSSVDFGGEMFLDDDVGGRNPDPPTPPLSLPDSFDNGYETPMGGHGHGSRGSHVTDAKLHAEVNRVMGLLTERTNTFRDLTISEGMYNELRLRPETDLTTYELAQFKSHEYVRSNKKEMESMRRTLQETQLSMVTAEHRAEEAEGALARQSKMAKLDKESMKVEVAALEDRCKRLAAKLKEETEVRQESEEKVANYDKQARELDSLAKEHKTLKDLYEKQSTALANLTVSEQSSRAAERDAERAKELLAMDKAYLSQELRATEQRADLATKDAEAANSKLVALEMKVQQLGDQLLNAQLDARTGVEERIEKETERIREDSKREMTAIKEASKEIIDRENKVLRDCKDSAEAEAEKLKQNMAFLQNENTRLQTELVTLQGKSVSDMAEIRAELQLKNFELTALGTTFEERMTQVRQTELELKTVKAESEAHKSAFVKLEAESDARLSELTAQLGVAKNRLKAYETLEEEIDSAVLRVAQAGAMSGDKIDNDGIDNEDVANLAGDLASKNFFATLQNMPSQPERRARQAVLLAQKVLETEGQRDEAKKEIAALRAQLKGARDQEHAADEALHRSSQPSVYLVTKLRDEEAAHTLTKARIKSLEHALHKKEQERASALRDFVDVKERLTLILHQRADVDRIREVLESLTHLGGDDEEGSIGDDMDEDGPHVVDVVNTSAFSPAPEAPASPRSVSGERNAPVSASTTKELSSTQVSKMTKSPSSSPTAGQPSKSGAGRWHKRESLDTGM